MFCNQCGTQLPDNSAVCSNCGASLAAPQAAPQPMQQPVEPQLMQGQPMQQPNQQFNPQMGQPMQQPNQQFNPQMGQPMQGQPMQFNPQTGQPMPGYGMPQQPKSNPLEFLVKKYPGEPFPMNGLFSVKNLLSKATTIDLVGVIAALIALISVFIPFISVSFWGEKESYNLISSDVSDQGYKMGWVILIVAIGVGVLYFLRMEFMAFLASCLNFILFISAWTFGAVNASGTDSITLSVGFWFYLLASITLVGAPYIWKLIKKEK